MNITNLEYIFRSVLLFGVICVSITCSIRINQLYVAFHPEGSFQIIYNILPGDREGSSTATGLYFEFSREKP